MSLRHCDLTATTVTAAISTLNVLSLSSFRRLHNNNVRNVQFTGAFVRSFYQQQQQQQQQWRLGSLLLMWQCPSPAQSRQPRQVAVCLDDYSRESLRVSRGRLRRYYLNYSGVTVLELS